MPEGIAAGEVMAAQREGKGAADGPERGEERNPGGALETTRSCKKLKTRRGRRREPGLL